MVHLPTPAEDAAIQAGIDADEDNPELDAAFFEKASQPRGRWAPRRPRS
jgi:hypothetical protein